MAKHWIMRAKYTDPKTGEVLYSPKTRSFPKALGQRHVASGDWVFVEEIEAEGRDTGGVAKWMTKEQIEQGSTPVAPPSVRPTLIKGSSKDKE